MLRFAARSVVPVAKYAGRKSLWVSLIAFVIWSGIEAYDGASDRFQARYTQAKDAVGPPVESTYEQVTTLATKLWHSIEANPGPSLLALSIFIFTIVYHKMSGKSLVQAVTATVTHAVPAAPPKPDILQKIDDEIVAQKLVEKEAALEALVTNLPGRIEDAQRTAEVLEKEAERARETADSKIKRASKARTDHDDLIKKLDEAKTDLIAVRAQLKTVT